MLECYYVYAGSEQGRYRSVLNRDVVSYSKAGISIPTFYFPSPSPDACSHSSLDWLGASCCIYKLHVRGILAEVLQETTAREYSWTPRRWLPNIGAFRSGGRGQPLKTCSIELLLILCLSVINLRSRFMRS